MHSCVLQFSRLVGQRFLETYLVLTDVVGYTENDTLDEHQIEASLTLLHEEREAYLKQLNQFAQTRKQRKQKGHRQPSRKEWAILHYKGRLQPKRNQLCGSVKRQENEEA